MLTRTLTATQIALRRSLRRSRRSIFTDSLQNLSNAYLELAVALPYPPTWPAYSSTIILIGAVSRLAVFPVFLWAHKRELRISDLVAPYLRAYREKLVEKAQRELLQKNSEAARKYYTDVINEKLKKRRNELFKQHRCTPWITMVTPPIIHVPIFLVISTVLYRAADGHNSVLRDEAFLTLSSLAHPDPTMTFPILFGIISMASIETSKRSVTAEQSSRSATEKSVQKRRNEITFRPSKYIKNVLRGLAVGRILFAALVPGCIELYWLTNAVLGIFQNWAINWFIVGRQTRRKAPG